MSEDIQLEELGQIDSPSNTEEAQEPKQEDIPEDWNSLSGKAQDRFKQIMKQKNEALKEREALQREREALQEERERLQRELEQLRNTRTAPIPPGGDLTPEEQAAVNRLKQIGAFASKEDVEAEIRKITERIQAERDREVLDRLHSSLESKFSGEDGLPAYDRSEIEDHMRKKGIYDPEAAYRDLYFEEIVEAKSSKQPKKEPYSEKTRSRIPSGTPWTPETLAERLRKPDGRQFYLKNADKINALYKQWETEGLG